MCFSFRYKSYHGEAENRGVGEVVRKGEIASSHGRRGDGGVENIFFESVNGNFPVRVFELLCVFGGGSVRLSVKNCAVDRDQSGRFARADSRPAEIRMTRQPSEMTTCGGEA
jgi:hypothetical protein